jgi:hypothetical protein
MKLPNFLEDADLNELRRRMGAKELGSFRLSTNARRFTVPELEDLIASGIDLRHWEEVRPLTDGTLCYKDRRVLLHRRDVALSVKGRARKFELPPFHPAHCSIVRRLRSADMTTQHAVSAREDGLFQVNVLLGEESQTSLEALAVCTECLDEIASLPALEGFTIKRFFTRYHRALAADTPSTG